MAVDDAGGAAPRGGRKRDDSRDAAILDAALDVLTETGYDGMTMDAVADRARAGKATLYRRWSSKEELVLAAVHHLRGGPIDPADLPDTGSLREDLLALFRPDSVEATEHRLNVIAGLASLLVRGGALRGAVEEVLSTPWTDAHHALMRRAADRGEIPPDADIDVLSRVAASMAAYRSLVQQLPFDREFLVQMVDVVILPALRGGGAAGDRRQAPPT